MVTNSGMTNARAFYSSLSDEQLAKEFQDTGNEWAFEVLIDRYKDYIDEKVKRILGKCGYWNLVDDVVIGTEVRVYQYISGFKTDKHFVRWLTAIFVNLCRTEIKKERRRREISLDSQVVLDNGSNVNLSNIIIDPEITIEDDYSRKEVQLFIRNLINELDLKYRKVVVLKLYRNLRTKDIAIMLGISESNVSNRLKTAKKQLERKIRARLHSEIELSELEG